MAEEIRGYYNEALDQTANAESFGTPLTNVSDDLMHIRDLDVSIHAENINIAESAFLEVTKRASRSQSVGHQPKSYRCHAEGIPVGVGVADSARVFQKSWKFPRGQLTLETGETLHNHFTNHKTGGTYDLFVDIGYHY